MRRVVIACGVLLVAGALVVGLLQAGADDDDGADSLQAGSFDLAAAKRALAGAPAPLAALHAQSNEVLGGGTAAFEERLRALRGHPVVVNVWASWCGPCRLEFPLFQALSTELGKRVAFLGVNTGDKPKPAAAFLADFPLPFPSYEDQDYAIARSIKAAGLPTTVFYRADGKVETVHAGGYTSETQLAGDIRTFLLEGADG
jgi:thiol-disulfide isomerase/thioredoxin